MGFRLSIIFLMLGYYYTKWWRYKQVLKSVGYESDLFPDSYKKTPEWMKKNHAITQQWIPGYMYYIGYTLLPGPLLVSICVVVLPLMDAPIKYSYIAVLGGFVIDSIIFIYMLIMTKRYVGSWKRFFRI